MSKSRYPIKLSKSDQSYLHEVYDGPFPKTKRRRAAILLRADESRADGGLSDQQIAEALECSLRGIQLVRKNACENGLRECVEGNYSGRPYVRKITGDVEAQLVALCCSEPPEGHARWSLRLLASQLVELEIVESIDHSSLHHCLKKMNLNLGAKNSGA